MLSDKPPYDPRVVANELIDLGLEFGIAITHLSLQKTIYFLHEKHLKAFGKPLCGGHFEAWKHGPVHPQLWTSFKRAGAEPIRHHAYGLDISTGALRNLPKIENKTVRRFIVSEGLALLEMPAPRLVGLSHARNGPWDLVTTIPGGKREFGARIPNDLIVQTKNARMIPIRNDEVENEVFDEQPPS
ncbi:type VI toxin-antitoxin system SocA family antitoxin [Parerythrobacter lacustris]|uniref:DUF4065 domain-containing protein n=1 Tax=Parerythrobacter lacustris TaxID=2969984 RepID=A0ABT1XLP3_9SPHN|nr:type II toxin-antitoxin system antitoxin SocA domain-containing protein [Parerythrobacter lacustris]MCR2832579.1 DUF4065 domain-containing protein [Parerythrobacter lacustris]